MCAVTGEVHQKSLIAIWVTLTIARGGSSTTVPLADQPVITEICQFILPHQVWMYTESLAVLYTAVLYTAVLVDVLPAPAPAPKKQISRKCLSSVHSAMMGPLPIKVKFPYAGLINSSSQSHSLTQQLENQRFDRLICQGYGYSQRP